MHTKPTYEDLVEERNFLRNLTDKASTIEAAFESTSNPIFSLDRNYRYLSFNRAHAATMKSLYGCNIRIGECLLDYLVEEDRTKAKCNLDRTMNGEQVVSCSEFSGDHAYNRRYFEITHNPIRDRSGIIIGASVALLDITERKQFEDRNTELVEQLQRALKEIKMLRGILPLCSFCKKIRNDQGYWEQVDVYISKYSEADVSHGICPECMKLHYPEAR